MAEQNEQKKDAKQPASAKETLAGCATLIVLVLIVVGGIKALVGHFTGGGKQTPAKQATVARTNGNQAARTVDTSQKKLDISYDRQDVFDDEGRQKYVVTITNNTDKRFEGLVYADAKSASGGKVDSDIIFLDGGLGPDGAKKAAILWFKNPDQIAYVDFRVEGDFKEVTFTRPDVEYEEVGSQAGLNYMTFFIYTPEKDRSALEKIVAAYKEKYPDVGGMQIMFFNDRKKTPAKLPMEEGQSEAWFANYNLNRSNGYEDLYFTH